MSGESARLRLALVERMQERGTIRSELVAAAFAAVPRELFLPDLLAAAGLAAVYADDAIPIKRAPGGALLSSSSQPTMMALMLELLAVEPGDRVLEIGAGSGYNAALLAELTGAAGDVVSVELDTELASRAAEALARSGHGMVQVVAGDGRQGYPDTAPYDRVIVTASHDQIARAWVGQLREGGRLVVPLRSGGGAQLIPAFERHGHRLDVVGHTTGSFVPLRD